jgi:hypothetical protein
MRQIIAVAVLPSSVATAWGRWQVRDIALRPALNRQLRWMPLMRRRTLHHDRSKKLCAMPANQEVFTSAPRW